jgi:hypothetical protein
MFQTAISAYIKQQAEDQSSKAGGKKHGIDKKREDEGNNCC